MHSRSSVQPQLAEMAARIDHLKQLEDGWLDGRGLAPPHDGLDWFAGSVHRHFPEALPRPYLYPTPEAGLRAEWSAGATELSLEIDLKTRTGFWHGLDLDDGTEQSREVDLTTDKDWDWIVTEIRRHARGSA